MIFPYRNRLVLPVFNFSPWKVVERRCGWRSKWFVARPSKKLHIQLFQRCRSNGLSNPKVNFVVIFVQIFYVNTNNPSFFYIEITVCTTITVVPYNNVRYRAQTFFVKHNVMHHKTYVFAGSNTVKQYNFNSLGIQYRYELFFFELASSFIRNFFMRSDKKANSSRLEHR